MISRGESPPLFPIMTTFEIAQALGHLKGRHSIACSEKGYFSENGTRISKKRAMTVLTALQQEAVIGAFSAPARLTFEKLNAATQALFFELCEQIQSATHDADMTIGARIGKDIPSIGLANAPRLTNLKKAGVFKHGGKGWLQLTERGRAIFLATV
jgi:hypothetical protein